MSELQQNLQHLQLAAQAVAHAYMEERAQRSVPGLTPLLTAVPLDKMIKDTTNRGAIATVLEHGSVRFNKSEASLAFGVNRATLSARIKSLKLRGSMDIGH